MNYSNITTPTSLGWQKQPQTTKWALNNISVLSGYISNIHKRISHVHKQNNLWEVQLLQIVVSLLNKIFTTTLKNMPTFVSQVPGLLLRSSKEAQFPHFIIQSEVELHATASGSPFEHTKTHTKTNGMSLCHCITTTTANKIASYSALEAQDNW